MLVNHGNNRLNIIIQAYLKSPKLPGAFVQNYNTILILYGISHIITAAGKYTSAEAVILIGNHMSNIHNATGKYISA